VKKTKKSIDSSFNFFAFKSIFVVSLYILIIYCFLYLINTKLPLNWHYKYEKTIMKIQKYLLTPVVSFFLLPMIFWLFHYVIKIRENLLLLRGVYTEKNFQFMIFWIAITWRIFLKEVARRECIGVSLVIFKCIYIYKKKQQPLASLMCWLQKKQKSNPTL
jgi:hypothetical protein